MIQYTKRIFWKFNKPLRQYRKTIFGISSSDKKACGFDTDMETEDSVEDDGNEFVAQADKLASMIVRIRI